MDWTNEVIDRLRAFWAEGLSTAEIGRRLGVSKNAVVGKAHRLGLDARPSPIRRDPGREAPPRPAIRRATGQTLPPMREPEPAAAVAAPPPPSAPPPSVPSLSGPPPSAPPPGPAPVRAAAPALRAVSRSPGRRVVACCWPIGEPGARSFRFCDGESVAGKPYCAQHAALAYVKVRDRREEAA